MIPKWNQQVFIYFILDMPIEEKWKKKSKLRQIQEQRDDWLREETVKHTLMII